MARYRTTVHSPSPTDTAFAYLADFANITEWDPSVDDAWLLAGQPADIGARYRVIVGKRPVALTLDYEIVERSTPVDGGPGMVALRANTRDVVSYDVITFTPVARGGCDVTYDADLAPQGWRRLFDPGYALVMQVIGHRASRGLAAVLADLPAMNR